MAEGKNKGETMYQLGKLGAGAHSPVVPISLTEGSHVVRVGRKGSVTGPQRLVWREGHWTS